MSHLGERVSPLVDGQFGADAADRALVHIAGCPECRQAVETERLTKQRLAALGAVPPGGDLVQRLLELAGPSGPLPPRPGHVPGSPRPQLASAGLRPPGRRGSSRPPLARPAATLNRMVRVSRSSRTRMAAAMVGAVCLVGAGVAGGVANGSVSDPRTVPTAGSLILQPQVFQPRRQTGSTLLLDDQTVLWKAAASRR